MPRAPRVAVGGEVYHALNRANARLPLFDGDPAYEQFQQVLAEAHQRVAMRTLSYCILPNHWHLVLWPRGDGDLSEFMRWLGVTHTQRWHASRGSAGSGHIYQGRFKSFPVQRRAATRDRAGAGVLETGNPVLAVCRYVERNALRAGLVRRAENWRWSSLWTRIGGQPQQQALLTEPPDGWPDDWLELVNQPQNQKELDAIRQSVLRSRPFGDQRWVARTAERLGLQCTLRPRGRPRKAEKGLTPFPS
jgi:putative transposase